MNFLKQKKNIAIVLVLLVMLFMPVVTSAAGLVPCGGETEDPCTVTDIFVLIARLTNVLLGLAGIVAVFQIVGASFWLITAGGNEEKITKNKDAISNAVVGMVLALMAFLLMNTVANWLLKSKCKIDLRNPINYLRIQDTSKCERQF